MALEQRIIYRTPTRLKTEKKDGPRPIPTTGTRDAAVQAFTNGQVK